MDKVVSTARFSVMVHGSPTGFFSELKGFEITDPLSPYLFIVVMEAFSCLLNRVVS